ncbi:MAG TPA: aldo/keto reductase [Chloroflexota bacterium]|nr:aldo/keto reductase [Chloroflexota bacterium]
MDRRDIVRALAALPALSGMRSTAAERRRHAEALVDMPYRQLGRTWRWVSPLGLGGQASLQWTAPGIDPADIVVRAVELGVNYLDTANAYGPSQLNYGDAFRRLHLTPYDPDYNHVLRQWLFVATKTSRRYALDRSGAATAIDDLKRSLTQLFGDGRGAIPDGAYVDSIQLHNLTALDQVDQAYEALDRRGGSMPDRIGALAGLLDYRDGTNFTGLNPERRRYLRHIGITGHQSSPVLMRALRRDRDSVIDTLLVALNANDPRYSSHQHNVVPVAVARDTGVVAMKAFADGVFYGKPPRFSNTAADVVRTVGVPGAISHADLVRYVVATPGVDVLITGIGQIDRDDPAGDQLAANLAAAVEAREATSQAERLRIEQDVRDLHGSETNYFQDRLRAPVPPVVERVVAGGDLITVYWHGGLAAGPAITGYQIYAGEHLLASLPFQAQTTLDPLEVTLPAPDPATAYPGTIRVVAVTEPPAEATPDHGAPS